MVTMKEVAERAGVSVATVSYVINDIRKVGAETERRVRQAAKELGYTPNRAARSLVAGRSSILGLIVPDICNPFFPEITKVFQEAANLAGMEAIVMNTSADPSMTRGVIERLMSLQVAGAAFLTSRVDPCTKELIAKRDIAAVYMDFGKPGRGISTIAIEYGKGMLEAVAHLVELGHRCIGLLGGPADGVAAGKRKEAFLEGVERARVESLVMESDFTVQGGYFTCSRLLSSSPKMTAVIAANDLMAIGALHCASDRQIRIPDQLSLIGFDDITFSQFTQPALTTVAIPRSEIGRLAFQSLSALMSGQKEGATYEVGTKLVVRQSTAPPRS